MAFLIDGNNLLHALAAAGYDLGRGSLTGLLSRALAGGKKVHVVFDGPRPSGPLERQISADGVSVAFSGKSSADDVLIAMIAADNGPRELVVVSTDHEIRRAARRRRCRNVTSEDFATFLIRTVNGVEKPSSSSEPDEKENGLNDEQARQWLREFGID
jgi:hypothetical protein